MKYATKRHWSLPELIQLLASDTALVEALWLAASAAEKT